jgi:hypothetical protein
LQPLRSDVLSIIVPVYNEVRTVRQVIDRLLEVPLPLPREIIVVNDGSTDGTMQVLDGVPPLAGVLSVVHAAANRGKGSAIRIGLSHARGTIIAIQDADLELDPVQLGDLVHPILRGDTDVVYGSRYLSGRPPGPRLSIVANRALTALTNLLFGGRLTDMETCYKVMRADVARSLDLRSNRFEIEAEISVKLLKQGRRIVERPVKFDPRNRASGKKIGWRDGVRTVVELLKHKMAGSRADTTATLIAIAAAAGLAMVGVVRGTYAAGGSDSSCYALMADSFASGQLQPTSELATRVPWPDASKTFAPGGFLPSQTSAAASVPICAPGFALLLAPFVVAGGRDALFLATPLAGALLVWAVFIAARGLGGPMAGAMAAVLTAVSPPVLYQVVQPMNDITTAALWAGAYAALLSRRWALAGACCGLALLVRPNLLPLGAVAALFVMAEDRQEGFSGRIARFCFAALPFAAVVLWLNSALYESPVRTGYGEPSALFSLSHVALNARYLSWLVETHTLFPLLALAAPFVVEGERRRDAVLALALVVATFAIYVAYTRSTTGRIFVSCCLQSRC